MDLNTILSCGASVTSIIMFGIEVYKIKSKDKKSEGSINSNIIGNNNSNTTNVNSNNTTTNQHTNFYNTTKVYNPSNSNTKDNSLEEGLFYILCFIIIGFILSKFYLENQTSIIFWIIMLGILSFSISMICVLILAKNNLIANSTLYIKTIKWFPLFIGIIFIYKPLYASNNIDVVASLIKQGSGYINTLFNYRNESLFFIFQVSGLLFTAVLFIVYLISTIIVTFKSLKTNTQIQLVKKTDIFVYTITLFFIFICVSGLYIKFFNYIS